MKLKNTIAKMGEVEWRRVKWLQPDDLKKQTKAQKEALKQSLINNGFSSPLFVWKNGKTTFIVDGHHRDIALRELAEEGVEIPDKLPAVFLKAKDEADAKKLVLIFTSQYSRFEETNLKSFIEGLNIDPARIAAEIDIPTVSIPKLLAQGSMDEIKEEPVPALKKKAVTKVGDVWRLGEHRLVCGSSLDPKVIAKLFSEDELANLIMTSPPYWIGKEYEQEKTIEEVRAFIRSSVAAMQLAIFQGESRIVINTGYSNATHLGEKHTECLMVSDWWTQELRSRGWFLRHYRMWNKGGGGNRAGMKQDRVISSPELILTYYNPNGKLRGQLGGDQAWAMQGVWTFQGDRQDNLAGYPVEMPARNIQLYTEKGEIVFEPFSGNGTNFIACEQQERRSYGVELMPQYCDIIVERWQNLTEGKAKRK